MFKTQSSSNANLIHKYFLCNEVSQIITEIIFIKSTVAKKQPI